GTFLLHRMREESVGGAEPEAAALSALRTTGGVIASAGIVLAATFAVLTTLPLVALVELGFVIAVGVLLDTFLVRTYLVTTASVLLRRRLWWPGRLSHAPEPARPERPAEPGARRCGGAGAPRPAAGAPSTGRMNPCSSPRRSPRRQPGRRRPAGPGSATG